MMLIGRNCVGCKRAGVLLIGLFLCCWCRAAPQKITVGNAKISVALNTAEGTLSVTDKRTGQTWQQKASGQSKVTQSTKTDNGIEITWRSPALDTEIKTSLRLDADKPELTISLSARGKPNGHLGFRIPL